MDSLELPFDIYWEGKLEPPSPSQSIFGNAEEDWNIEDDFATTDMVLEIGDILSLPLERKKAAEQLLIELERDIKDEQWLNEKIDLPTLEDFSVHLEPISVQPIKHNTEELLLEFESVYDAVELTHLTPPQTPPSTPPQKVNGINIDQTFIYQPQEIMTFNIVPTEQSEIINSLPLTIPYSAADHGTDIVESSSPMSQDIENEMNFVEELVRSRAQDLPDWTDDDNSSGSMSSPGFSPRSEASYSSSSHYSQDDEWFPPIKNSKSSTFNATSISDKEIATSSAKLLDANKFKGGSIRKRVRPYARGSEDKKSRKKEQNKNAATRYRKKKKQEIEEILEDERKLQKVNDKLQTECSDIKREIKYLKSLMRELYKAKGVLV